MRYEADESVSVETGFAFKSFNDGVGSRVTELAVVHMDADHWSEVDGCLDWEAFKVILDASLSADGKHESVVRILDLFAEYIVCDHVIDVS